VKKREEGQEAMEGVDQVAVRRNEKLIRELGPLVTSCLNDSRTEDILLNADSTLWVKRTHADFEVVGKMASAQALSAFGTIAAIRDTVINHENPILETELPTDGSRFEGLIPPVVRQPVFAIRQRPRCVFTLTDYEGAGILTDKNDLLNRQRHKDRFVELVRGKRHIDVMRAAIEHRKNILVAGSTGSGKTTFINALLAELAAIAPADRVLIIEDTPELQCNVRNSVALLAVGRVTMLDCLRACMRLKPTRIVVGEVRGGEALSMLKAWNTGHPGGAASVHANDARGALIRVESLVAEATEAPQQQLIAEAVNLVVFVDNEPTLKAARKVREVAVVMGYSNGAYELEYV
jgi:type IV secretion system protein VirB11